MNIFWFRRDLRLEDNLGLQAALGSGEEVLPVFIFDTAIIDELSPNDARISFIYGRLEQMNSRLKELGSGMLVKKGDPSNIFRELLTRYDIKEVFVNQDYEPYARERDQKVKEIVNKNNIAWNVYKDHVIFEPHEVLKADKRPYSVYTPFKNAWLKKLQEIKVLPTEITSFASFHKHSISIPSLERLGFNRCNTDVLPYDLSVVADYHQLRDMPAKDSTSRLGPHLRFGTVGIRTIAEKVLRNSPGYQVFLNELIWREFFIQILWHFPHVVHRNFRQKYDGIQWRNDEVEFKKWCKGETGYPMVDAGMRQLNETGYMHNRVRMVTAGFLCKHLLIDWRWGEAYFAQKLLDYELASNNGNWQWAAGTGCDAAPYFRVFNPSEQIKKFDPDFKYIKKWVPEVDGFSYPQPLVEHKFARERAIRVYKEGLDRG